MATDYQLFDQVEQLMNMRENPRGVTKDLTGVEYQKLVQTGGLAEVHHDYGTGFLVVSIFTASPGELLGRFCTRVWFATIDDGDFGAWGQVIDDFDQALEHARQVAEIFRPMVKLPTQDELNEMLRPHGLWAGRE